MSNNTKIYNVNELYLLTTYRKIRVYYDTVRYITEYYIGKKSKENYTELFTEVEFEVSKKYEAQEFDKIYIVHVDNLSKHIDKISLNKKEIFDFITKINSLDRTCLDILDEN